MYESVCRCAVCGGSVSVHVCACVHVRVCGVLCPEEAHLCGYAWARKYAPTCAFSKRAHSPVCVCVCVCVSLP